MNVTVLIQPDLGPPTKVVFQAREELSLDDIIKALALHLTPIVSDAGMNFETTLNWPAEAPQCHPGDKQLTPARAQPLAAAQKAEPVPYLLGNFYRTQEGKLVRFVEVHLQGTMNETMEDESGVNRYTRRDFGRVTGSCHEYSDPRNTPPLYAHPDPAGQPVPELANDRDSLLSRAQSFVKFVAKCVRKNGEYAPLHLQEMDELNRDLSLCVESASDPLAATCGDTPGAVIVNAWSHEGGAQ